LATPLTSSSVGFDRSTTGPSVAKAPHAGKLDIYRMRAPEATGKDGCVQ
jgi:hypothetical protein